MDFFQTLILGSEAYQSYKLNQIEDGIAELNARQEQQIADQQRLQTIINEVDEFQQRLIECRAEFDSKPGHAVYWAFRFLRWCEFEGVCRRSLPDLANKDHFSRTVQMTQEIFDYGRKLYSKDEMFAIKRLVYLDCGYLAAIHELICWRKIYAGMHGKWYFYKPSRMEELVGIIAIGILAPFTLFIGLAPIIAGIIWKQSLAKKKLRELAPLATECGGFLTEAATREDVARILHQATQGAIYQRINVDLSTLELEKIYQLVKEEYEQSCTRYLAEAPQKRSLGAVPDVLPPGSQN